MNIWIKHSALLAMSATMLASAHAQPRHDDRPDARGPAPSQQNSRPVPGHMQPGPGNAHDRAPNHAAPRPTPPVAQRPVSRPPQQAQHDRRDFRRGERLPSGYRSNHYVVDNWRTHGLRAPQRGQHWVQVGNDYLLVSIATGVIASVFNGH